MRAIDFSCISDWKKFQSFRRRSRDFKMDCIQFSHLDATSCKQLWSVPTERLKRSSVIYQSLKGLQNGLQSFQSFNRDCTKTTDMCQSLFRLHCRLSVVVIFSSDWNSTAVFSVLQSGLDNLSVGKWMIPIPAHLHNSNLSCFVRILHYSNIWILEKKISMVN